MYLLLGWYKNSTPSDTIDLSRAVKLTPTGRFCPHPLLFYSGCAAMRACRSKGQRGLCSHLCTNLVDEAAAGQVAVVSGQLSRGPHHGRLSELVDRAQVVQPPARYESSLLNRWSCDFFLRWIHMLCESTSKCFVRMYGLRWRKTTRRCHQQRVMVPGHRGMMVSTQEL